MFGDQFARTDLRLPSVVPTHRNAIRRQMFERGIGVAAIGEILALQSAHKRAAENA